jgi:hypothetical protein
MAHAVNRSCPSPLADERGQPAGSRSQSAAVGLSQWPPTDEQIRRFASTAFSRAGYQIPLLDEVRCMTHHTLTATMQATCDYLEQQALPDRRRPSASRYW